MVNELNLGSQTPYLLIVAVVAVVAVVTLVLNNGSLQGAQVIVPSADPRVFCDGSMENIDIYEKGFVMEGRLRYEDECRGNKLYQWTCEGTAGADMTAPVDCEFGCIRGACCRSAEDCF